jgi:hypothetical protein
MSGTRKQNRKYNTKVYIYRHNKCGTKFMIIPVITGATGIVTEGLKKNLEAITGKYSTDSLQILGT